MIHQAIFTIPIQTQNTYNTKSIDSRPALSIQGTVYPIIKSTPKKFKVNPIKKSMLTLSLLAILGVSIEMGDKK